MKKVFYVAVLFLLLIIKVNVKASEVTLVKERIGNLYTYYYDENLGRDRFLYLNKYVFGENYAYCIELGKNINGNIYSYSTSFDDISLSDNDLEYIKLVSYYGYDYPGHKTDRYYMAAQELIWMRLSNIGVKWVVDFNTSNLVDVSNEKEEILDLVRNHYVKPSFDRGTVDIVKGEFVTLVDDNSVLSNYGTNSEYVKIDGNSLTIDSNIDVDKIVLTKNVNTDKVFLLYTNGTSQKMMSSGMVNEVKSEINLNVIGGSIAIKKLDSEKEVSQGEATLDGAKYNLYDSSGNLMGTFITGKRDRIDNLSIGEYYLKEIEPSIGYRLDDNVYYVSVTKDSLDVEVTVYEEVIKRKVDIFKVFASSSTGLLTPEEGIIFEVYDKDDNLVSSLKTDKDGYMSTVLPYGTYTLKQITTPYGYEKIKNYQIIIDEDDDRPIYKLFTDAEITSKVKVLKKDYDTKEIIINSNAKFKIYNVKKNEYVSFKMSYPEEKVLDTFEVKDGVFITPGELSSGTYRLYEVDDKMDGYLYNDEAIEFVIGEDSNFIFDDEDGKILEVSFYNKPVKGKIEVYKYGEDIIYQNDTYKYREILLSGVRFNLYSKNNIYENNRLIYSMDTLVGELMTDDNGYSFIDNLPLGDYYLREISSSMDNEVSDVTYDIGLKYVNQYMDRVLSNVDIYNYIKKGSLVINKYDKELNTPLENTLIEIRKDDNTVIYKGYTDKNGQIIINDLKYGDYFLAEVEASSGYQLLGEKVPFTIDKDEVVVDIYNERILVPNTGFSLNIYIIVIIISLVISFIFFILMCKDRLISILCTLIIVLCLLALFFYYFRIYSDRTKNTKAIDAYLTNKIDNNYDEKYRYNTLLEIPSINLKRGILDIDNEYNKAKYNIELVKEDENCIVLASHNGNFYNSYFGELSKLELGDVINYYKDGNIYQYIYSDSYEIRKDGYADLYYKSDKNSIILITCKDGSDDAQVVHIGYLKEIIPS